MNSSTKLYRQIHPSWIDEISVSSQAFEIGITSQAFTPTQKDENKLSVANGDKLSAQDSYEKHTLNGNKSVGVMSVLGNKCETVELPYNEDNNPYDGHSHIDFSSCKSRSDVKDKAKKLKAFAMARGWLYKPDEAI